MFVVIAWVPFSTRPEKTDAFTDLHVVRPHPGNAVLAMHHKIDLKISRGRIDPAEGVSSAHRLVLPRLGFLYFFYIKWPAVVGPCWREKQLDIMISKRKFASSQARARKTETHHSAG